MSTLNAMETTITEEKALGFSDLRAAWSMYTETFGPLAELAAQRHVMTWDEFADMGDDPRIVKHLSHREGTLIGIGVQTTDLAAWPLISPPYFERRWPELYSRGHIWYVGFVGVRQHPRSPAGTFAALLEHMSAPTRAVGGISVMDFCTHNEQVLQLPAGVTKILRRFDPGVVSERVDAQAFWAQTFTPPAAAA